MTDRHGRSSVRTHGAEDRPTPQRPRTRVAVLLGAIGLGATLVTYLGGDPGAESDRSAITSPTIDDPPTAVTSVPVTAPPVFDPLDRRVPGFDGRLVLTMGTSDGIEVWEWSSGTDGALARSTAVADTYDARPEPSGRAFAAIHRYGGRAPSLMMGSQVAASSVFSGVEGFAWSRSENSTIVWVERRADPERLTIHFGRWVGNGVAFKATGEIPESDLTLRSGTDRLVAFDVHGLVFERHGSARDVSVLRIGLDGSVGGSATGHYAGSSPEGILAVTGDRTVLLGGPDLATVGGLNAAYRSVVWSGDGRIAGATENGLLDLIDGSATRTVDLGVGPTEVLTWSANSRFVIASASIGDEPALVFVDTATLDVATILVSGQPLAAIALP